MSNANTLATQKSSEERFTGFLFWVVLPDGRHNSLSCNSLYYAPQRARALGAKKLFVKNLASGNVAQVF
jgi:hypothetical protein